MRQSKTIYKHCVKFKGFFTTWWCEKENLQLFSNFAWNKKMALSLYCFVLLLTLCLDAMTSGNFRISSPLPMKELEPRFGRSILSWLGSFLFRVPYTKTYIFFSLLPRLDKVLIFIYFNSKWVIYLKLICLGGKIVTYSYFLILFSLIFSARKLLWYL